MTQSAQVSVCIIAGFVFIITGILADTWPMRLIYCGLGMATLLAGVFVSGANKAE